MTTQSPRVRKVTSASGALASGALIGLILGAGHTVIPRVFALIGHGVWGYLGVAGCLAVLAPVPLLVLWRRWSVKVVMLVGAATLAVAHLGGVRQWPSWAVLGWGGVVALGFVTWRVMRYIPALLTMRRAERLLRRHRSDGHNRVWSLDDWAWAYAHLGTPIALELAAKFRRLRSVDRDEPDQRPT